MPEARALSLAVGELVEFSARSGDLLSEAPAGPSALAGVRGHQREQARRDERWQAERPLRGQLQQQGWNVRLRGRVDLYLDDSLLPRVEEIKTTLCEPQHLPANRRELHWAQARVYAYLALAGDRDEAADSAPAQALVRVSWLDLSCERLHSEERVYECAELEAFTRDLLDTYLAWYRQVCEQREVMLASARGLDFPHPEYRPRQLPLARTVYRCARDGESLLLEAPTGSGKTLSVLYPALRALGEEQVRQVVYLTAKGPGQQHALQTARQLREAGWSGSVLLLQARQKTCPCQGAEAAQFCPADGPCSFTLGYYERLPEARLACLRARLLDPGRLQALAAEHRVCPFALALEMLPWCDLVICDFNYVFDPLVRLSLWEQGAIRRLLLVDEIHNLPERARAMYSARLDAAQCRAMAAQLERRYPDHPTLARDARRLAQTLQRSRGETPPDSGLCRAVETLLLGLAQAEQPGAVPESAPRGQQQPLLQEPEADLGEWKKQLYRYLCVADLYGDAHRHLVSGGRERRRSELLCLDAAGFLAARYRAFRAAVGFSATLQPLPFYATALGLESATCLQFDSVFPAAHQLTLLAGFIDTRWQQRAASLDSLAQLIALLAESKAGKYLVFFPSYQYLQDAHQCFAARYPHLVTRLQAPGEDAAAREAFVAAFLHGPEPQLGFAVLGGLYAEAVDFAGEALAGCIVVGPGLAQPDRRQQLLQDYYRGRGLDGFDYGSRFPGFTRVQQAAGRVLRSERDRGVVILVDPRFRQAVYRRLYPRHWQPRDCRDLAQVESCLQHFWAAQSQ